MTLTRITSDGITDATIATADLADQSVTLAKIADDAVNGNKIANGAVGGDAILDNAIGTVKIQDNAITLAKLPHGDGSSDGKFLRANNGADPTFESVVTDLVNDTSPQLGGDLDTNSFEINLDDNHSVNFGDSTDLNIKHTGVYGVLQNTTGNFFLQGENALTIKANNNVEILKATGDENMAKFIPDGAVELYHDNSKKFETYANGCTVTGNLNAGNVDLGDNAKARFGGSNDLQIYHDGTNTYLDNNTGQFNIDAASGNGIRFLVDGVYQCQVYTSGIDLPDTKKLRLGDSEDLQIFHDGSLGGSNIAHVGSGNLHIRAKSGEESIVAVPDGQVEIYHDSSKKFETDASGINVTGDIDVTGKVAILDNQKLICGVGDDLQIYHDGNNSFIDNTGIGNLNLYGDDINILNKAKTEFKAKFITNGAVELYYDNYKAYVTHGGGGASNGMLSADSVLNLNTSQDGSGSDYFVRGSKNSTAVGAGNDVFWIYEDGDMYNVNGTFSQSSDSKLKENIVDASSQWSDIKALKVRKFNFKASTGYGTHTQIGMVAQEVETTCPGLITERVDLQKTENSDKTWTETDTGEKTKSIKLTVLYMKAVKALQEAMTRIETLETEVAALKAG
jgi:hypothetical protein